MKKLIMCTLALCALIPVAGAQQKKTAPVRKKAATADAKSFYHTPYRTRNSGSYDIDSRMISLGYGFGSILTSRGGYVPFTRDGNRSGFGPVMVKYEHAIRDEVGIGAIAELAYRKWKYNSGGTTYHDRAFGVGIAVLGYYHFNKFIPVPKLDVYAGVGLSISNVSYKDGFYDNTSTYTDINPAEVAGARYLFTESFSAYGEIGRTSYSWVNLGVSFKL